EFPGNHVVPAAARQVLQQFAKDVALELGTAGPGGRDEPGRDPRVKGRGDQRCLAVSGHPGNADLLRIDARIRVGLEIVNETTDPPGPGAQRAPVVGFAGLALVGQANNAFAQLVVVPLNAVGIDGAVPPGFVERLLGPRIGAAPAARPAPRTERGWAPAPPCAWGR